LEDSEQNNFETKSENVFIKKSTFYGLIIGVIIIIAVAGFFAGSYITNLNSDKVTQKELQNAISKLELKVLQKQLPSTQSIGPVRISVDDDPMKGNPNAPITIIEFSDFQCPFCARFHAQTWPQLEENYISTGKVNFVYRDFPIQSIHSNALPAALASECADDQDKFWEMHDMIFENQNSWQGLKPSESTSLFKEYAIEIGLNADEFGSCITSGKYLQEIQNDLDDGRVYGVTGTPGFFIGNEEIGFTKLIGAQPFPSFKQVIDEQLSR